MSKLSKPFWSLVLLGIAGGVSTTLGHSASITRQLPGHPGFRMPRPECSWTPLPNGRLLLAGGIGEDTIANAECFDPKDGGFHPDGPLKVPRSMHSAVLLKDGRVLLVGGLADSNQPWPTEIEIYDPAIHRSQIAGKIPKGVAHPAAILLKDGTVFIAGLGYRDQFAARFDPRNGELKTIGHPAAGPMTEMAATRLATGAVLVTGWGMGGHNAFLYDPTDNAFLPTGPMNRNRFGHTSLLMSDGRVFIAGGYQVRACEIYDPKRGIFTEVGNFPDAMTRPHAALLPSGKILVVGGREGRSMRNEACVFDPTTSTLKEIQAPQGFFLMSGMLQQSDGSVWLVSDMGVIAKFNPRTETWN